MVQIITDIEIAAPIEKVAAFAADPDQAPKWYVNIKSVEWVTSRPLAVGSKLSFQADFLGRRLSYIYEVVEYKPMDTMVMRTAQGPFPMETTYRWEALDEQRTRMTLQNKGEPAGFSNLMTPLIEPMMRRANQKDLKKIKEILES